MTPAEQAAQKLKTPRTVLVVPRTGDPELAIPDLTVVLQPSASNGCQKVSDLLPQHLTCLANANSHTSTPDSCHGSRSETPTKSRQAAWRALARSTCQARSWWRLGLNGEWSAACASGAGWSANSEPWLMSMKSLAALADSQAATSTPLKLHTSEAA
jgi:hypothetical protein